MTSRRSRWCGKCSAVHSGDCKEQVNWKRTRKTKGKTTTERGYGAAWRRKRKRVIARDNGLCQPCLKMDIVKAFDEVDHIVPISQGGDDQLDNLQCICKSCHKHKTQREAKGR